ncbi:MAG: hypothetical protein CK541_03300 [Opitutia bacterium]|nr:MAG: hypothetical protein CK541_03300 [Opitutae bacterium]
MKTALALLAALAFVGCSTQIGVDNTQNSEASFSNATGVLNTRYSADAEAVFNAVKRTIDAMPSTLRTGETDVRGPNKELLSVVVYVRTIGDLEIKITIEKTEDEVTKAIFTQVQIKYGFFGNLPESQKIVSKITSNLR